MKSPATRELVKNGMVKVVGAIYDVGTGKRNWLQQTRVTECSARGEDCPFPTLIYPKYGGIIFQDSEKNLIM